MCLNLPNLTCVYVDIDSSPQLGATHSVFIAPTILLFTFGKESIRESRFIVLKELEDKITRYLQLID